VPAACRRTRAQEREVLADVSKERTGSHDARCDTRPENNNQSRENDNECMPHIVGKDVQWAVVRVRFLVGAVPNEVLRDEMGCTWVKAASKEAAGDEVYEDVPAPKVEQEIVEGDLCNNVANEPSCRFLCPNKARTKCVEENLEGAEEDLAEDIIEAEELCAGRQVGVDSVLALELVVLDVVRFEQRTVRNADRQIGDDGKGLVELDILEGQVVGNLVNGEEEILVRRAANRVRSQQELPGQWIRVAQQERRCQLNRNDQKDDPFRERLVSHKFRDLQNTGHQLTFRRYKPHKTNLWMSLQYFHAPRAVWLFSHEPQEVARVLRCLAS